MPPSDLTLLLEQAQAGQPGEQQAREALFALAYPELKRLAHARLRDGGHKLALDTTALVHESYLRFQASGALRATERRGFFAFAAQVMRSVIVDTVREHQAQRRGGELEHITLDSRVADGLPCGDGGDEVLQVHEALQRLAEAEPELARLVEMRYFGGFSDAEIAETLAINERTVRRHWDKARLLLLALLEG
jgi:RNA polymerase sigma factor (TIGR02999 family)